MAVTGGDAGLDHALLRFSRSRGNEISLARGNRLVPCRDLLCGLMRHRGLLGQGLLRPGLLGGCLLCGRLFRRDVLRPGLLRRSLMRGMLCGCTGCVRRS